MLQATRSTNFRRTTTRTEILTRRDPGRLSSSFPLKDLFACRPRKRKLFSTLGGIAAVTAGITLAKPVALWLAEKLPSPISDMIQVRSLVIYLHGEHSCENFSVMYKLTRKLRNLCRTHHHSCLRWSLEHITFLITCALASTTTCILLNADHQLHLVNI